MPLPPEHISIKRRRQEEPVDTLYLEPDHRETKRRFTQFYFQRVRAQEIVPPLSLSGSKNGLAPADKQVVNGGYGAAAVPLVRATSPGAENRHEAQRKLDRARRLKELQRQTESSVVGQEPSVEPTKSTAPNHSGVGNELPRAARRFHLSRHPTPPLSAHQPSGIRKHKSYKSPYLATFVERRTGLANLKVVDSFASRAQARDALSDRKHRLPKETNGKGTTPTKGLSKTADTTTIQPVQPVSVRTLGASADTPGAKARRSFRDHTSTLDRDSDRLADELAAFALEIESESRSAAENAKVANVTLPSDASVSVNEIEMDDSDGFVYETYVRVPIEPSASTPEDHHDLPDSIGVLVIEEENEELWQIFAESDEETEWDEEDADSNAEDNPANDYPEDEVSSDDEYDYGAYTYRNKGSDEEEYDLHNHDWSDDNYNM